MKSKTIVIVIVLLLSWGEAFTQGFDWQYSARLPFNTPRFFIGLSGTADFTYSIATLPLLENDYRLCCNLGDGTGFSGALGLNFEYWPGNYSIFLKVMYGYYRSGFSAQGEAYPIRGGGTLISEYTVNTDMQRIILEPGARFRLFGSYFRLDCSLRSSIITKFTYDITDSEADIGETYNPRIPDYNQIFLQFNLGLSYDFSVGLGKYSSFGIYTALPVLGISRTNEWLPISIGATFTYNNGL